MLLIFRYLVVRVDILLVVSGKREKDGWKAPI